MSVPGLAGLEVALVGPLPPPAGGMANQTGQLAELLRAEGAQVELVQTNAAYRPAWAGRVPLLRALVRLLPYLWALWRAAGHCQLLHVMANSGWSWHLFAAPAIWIGAMRGRPVLVNYRGGEAATFLQRAAPAVRASLRRTRALVVPSGFLREVFAVHGVRADILPNVVDLQRFRPAEVPVPDDGAALHLLVARNLEPLYDNATAIRAFAALQSQRPGLRLTVAGTGPEGPALQALARELGVADAVHFAGRVERDGMAALYRRSHLSLNPSLADNMPNSVLESLASGVPVVSTHVGGVPYLVEDGVTALLVPPRDVAAMQAAIARLLDDAALHAQLRRNGLAEVQRYTWGQVAPLLADFYARCLAKASPLTVAAPRS